MEAIEASATLRYARISPQKTRLVADMIRGKNVEEAKRILAFTERKAAAVIGKLLNSAIANAEVKNVEDPEILSVAKIWVDQGPTHRRHMPRARGRVNILRRPTSHITVVVAENLAAKEEAAAKLAAVEAKKATKKQAKAKKADAPKTIKADDKAADQGDE
jgi:large subunit ribosomal protein L22